MGLFFNSKSSPENKPEMPIKRPEPPKMPDKSLFGGKSEILSRDLKFRLKKEFKTEAPRHGLYSSHWSEVDKALSKIPSGRLKPYHIDQVIREQEQELRNMAGKDFAGQKVKRGLIDFLKTKKNQK